MQRKFISPLTYTFIYTLFLLLSISSYSQQKVVKDSLPRTTADTTVKKTDSLTKKEGGSSFNSWWENLPSNLSVELIGGALCFILGSGITVVFSSLKRKIHKRKFKQIFGTDLTAFSIVYPSFLLQPVYDQQGNLVNFPFTKGNGVFKMSEPVALADLKAAIYVTELFFKETSNNPTLQSDQSVKNKLDFSYCSVGGLSNDKTIDMIADPANTFYRFDTYNAIRIVRIFDNKDFFNSNTHDLGIIVKIRNSNFPNRTQFCIAGLGEYGTSGAAWYLARHWKQLRKQVKDKDFGAIIKVKNGVDESAFLIDLRTN